MSLCPHNFLAVVWKTDTHKLKENNPIFIALLNHLVTNGMHMPVGHWATTQTLESDWTLPPSFPVPQISLWDFLFVCFITVTAQNMILQRYAIIERNAAWSNVDTEQP